MHLSWLQTQGNTACFLCSEWSHVEILDSARAILTSCCRHTCTHKGSPTDWKETGKGSGCEKIRWLWKRGTTGHEPHTLLSWCTCSKEFYRVLIPPAGSPSMFLAAASLDENSRHSKLSCIPWAWAVSACWGVSSLWKFKLAQATFLVLPGKISWLTAECSLGCISWSEFLVKQLVHEPSLSESYLATIS